MRTAVFFIILISIPLALIAEPITSAEELYMKPSFIPAEEAYTHIAGGFFSVFESRVGRAESEDGGDPGSCCIQLKKLNYQSKFVYLPEGDIILKNESGSETVFKMEKLDYVEADGGLPYYRISCSGGRAYLICYATVSTSPVLYGTFLVVSETGAESRYNIRISGRNENRADNHLHKVIAAVTEL